MLNKRELSAIRKALPKNAYELIAERTNKTPEAVGKILNEPKRYNAEVIYTALQVIEEHKEEIAGLKHKIKEVTA